MLFRSLAISGLIFVGLNGCGIGRLPGYVGPTGVAHSKEDIPAKIKSGERQPLRWQSNFAEPNWLDLWGPTAKAFGDANARVVEDPDGKFRQVLRVMYPQGSWSPLNTVKAGKPLGGLGFLASCGMQPRDQLYLRYYVRFEHGFNFVKGGKLPGLYGGKGNSGGNTPDGTDGFSTRLMWRSHGDGEVYAYLPTRLWPWGVSIGRGNWRFEPGRWYLIEQHLALNTPGKKDGYVRLWVDEKLVIDQRNLRFRDIPELKIDGIMFSTFFGGDDETWATPKTTYVYFANFALSEHYIGP